jgi:hypothetical protein
VSRKHFSLLAAATLLAVLAVTLLLPGRVAYETVSGRDPVLPGLQTWVNDADRLTDTRAGNKLAVTLARQESGWVVEELSGYPADWSRVRETGFTASG